LKKCFFDGERGGAEFLEIWRNIFFLVKNFIRMQKREKKRAYPAAIFSILNRKNFTTFGI